MSNEKWKVVNGEWRLVDLDATDLRLPAACPWRRFFARGFDLNLYFLLWQAFAYLILHLNIFGWNIRSALVSYALMILIEPFLLRFFGTTPGKAIFGIRIRNAQGEKLSLSQGFRRVGLIFVYGYGCSIPILNIVRHVKSYKQCKIDGFMLWDRDEYYREEVFQYYVNWKQLPVRTAAYILISALIAATIYILPAAADMPRHRGELSAEQFHANVQRYMRFHNLIPPDNQYVVWFPPRNPPPPLNVVETNGVVTEISFELVNGDFNEVWGLESRVRAYIVSFVGAQQGANFWNMHFARGNVIDEIFPLFWIGWGHSSHSHTAHGVEIIYDFEIDSPSRVWDPEDPINVRFVMRKV